MTWHIYSRAGTVLKLTLTPGCERHPDVALRIHPKNMDYSLEKGTIMFGMVRAL